MKISVACIVRGMTAATENKILIARRHPTGAMGGRWEFPGGKVDGNEGDAAAIEREMREEFGVRARAGKKVCEGEFVHDGKKNLLHAYFVSFERDGLEEPFILTEHSEYKWVFIDEIYGSYKNNFVDSDLSILDKVWEALNAE